MRDRRETLPPRADAEQLRPSVEIWDDGSVSSQTIATPRTTGRVWQGRFKAFVAQQDHHLLTVMRYVERNALRARLVERAEDWEWGSLAWRRSPRPPLALAESPVPLPSYWRQLVNEPQTAAELAEIRNCVNRQRPFGDDDWVKRQVQELGLEQTLRRVGRPSRVPIC